MTKMRQWTIFTVLAVLVVVVVGWMMLVKPQKSKAANLRSQAATQQQQNQVLLTQIASLEAESKALPQQQLSLAKFTTEVPNDASEPALIRQLSTAANGAGIDLLSLTPGTATQLAAPAAALGSTPATGTTTPATGTTTTTTGTTTTTPSTTGAPAAGVAAPTLNALPIALSVTGSYANLVSFFSSLENLPRAMLVSGWSMCPLVSTGGTAQGGANCSAPTVPGNKKPPSGTLGATLNATVFFSPAAPAATTLSPTGGTTATGTTGTTTTPTTGASTAPAS